MTGSIRSYTPNFDFIIPEFNITGWHDYLEENFRSIDALLNNLFEINNYSGIWKKLTSYTVGQVLFIGDTGDYSGRLVKVLINHTTTNDDFTTFYTNNPTYYELFADASDAQIYAQKAKDWAIKTNGPVEGSNYSSKYYAEIVNSISAEINFLYNMRNDLQTLVNISTDISDVANNSSNINTVAEDHSNINTVVNNLTAINNAPTYANNAKTWAEGTDEQVSVIGGTHSAKGWAEQEANNYSVTTTGTTTARTLKDRFADSTNVKDYGAKGDGVTDDATAIQAMITDKGYALFPAGTFRCSTSTFTGKFYFDVGAALTVNSGEKITLQGTIQSSKQWIFKGDGDYDIKIAAGQIGSDKHIHISWFGVFPTNQEYCSTKIQKAIDSYGNTREGVIDFDSGVYYMDTTVNINRGIWLRGSGSRRTVFGGAASDFVYFQTAEQAVRITGFQFEDGTNTALRTQPYIWLKHQNCELDDIRVGDKCEKSILVEANNCRIKNILYKVHNDVTYSSSSYIIKIKGDDNILDYVSNAYRGNTVNQTNCIVEVDGTRNVIQNIINYNDSYAVYINPSSDISNNTITGVYNYNASGNKCAIYAVTNSHSIDNTTITGVNVYNDATEAIKVIVSVNNVSVTNMFIDNVNVYGTCDYIFYLDNQGNLACGVNIGRNIMFAKEPTIQYLYKNGNWNNAVINSFDNNKSPYIKNISVADDSVYVINLPFKIYQSMFYLCKSYSIYYLGIVRAANNPNYTTISSSNTVDVVTQALDGTTGTDGHITIGIQDSKIYIENRLGSTSDINFGLLSGIY